MKRIVIISDCSDVAYNEMRAKIISYLDKKEGEKIEVEPLVKAKEFSLINATFLVRLMAEIYPSHETIFLVVANAIKTNTEKRARIIGETLNGLKFVGANTGALNWLIEDFGLKSLYEFERINLTGKDFVSFGGKYFHAPMAAKIAKGISMEKLGIKKSKKFLANFHIKEGTVVHIDNFNVPKIKSNIPKDFKEGDLIEIIVNGKKKAKAKFTFSMKDLPDGTLTLFPGSSLNNLPEIAKVRKLDSAKSLGIKIGDIVKFKKIK